MRAHNGRAYGRLPARARVEGEGGVGGRSSGLSLPPSSSYAALLRCASSCAASPRCEGGLFSASQQQMTTEQQQRPLAQRDRRGLPATSADVCLIMADPHSLQVWNVCLSVETQQSSQFTFTPIPLFFDNYKHENSTVKAIELNDRPTVRIQCLAHLHSLCEESFQRSLSQTCYART